MSCYGGLVGEAIVSHPRATIRSVVNDVTFGDFDMYGGRGGGILGCDYSVGGGWFVGPQAIATYGRSRGHLGAQVTGEMAAEATVRLRVGTMMSPNAAVYVAGGPVVGQWQVGNDVGQRVSMTLYGGQVALGLEYFLTPNWRVGVEYAFSHAGRGTSRYTAGRIAEIRSEPPEHITRAFLSYAFSGDRTAYVAPRRPGPEQLSCYAGVLAEGVTSHSRADIGFAVGGVAFSSFDLGGGRGGGVIGCDYRFASGWFVGPQAVAAFGRVSGRLVGAFKGELPAEGALRARIGTAIGNDVAVYIAGGPLAGRWKATNESGQSNSKVVLGGQAAVGLEYYLTPHWRVGAEYAYNYYDYENSGFTVGPISYVKPEPVEHIGRLLLSYVF